MKSLIGVITLMLALTLGIFNLSFAAENRLSVDFDAAWLSKVADACKGKMTGYEVTVEGKKTKCTAPATPAVRETALGGPDTASRISTNMTIERVCKDKKPGTEVTVEGKKMKCPEIPGKPSKQQ